MSEPITLFVSKSSSDLLLVTCQTGEIKDWRVTRRGLKNYFMLIGFQTSSIYIIKMQIGTLQHTQAVPFSETHKRGGWDRRRRTYQERKCHLLARPTSQWSPSSSSEWRIPAAQRQEPPHRWTCVTQGTSHGDGYTKCGVTHRRKIAREVTFFPTQCGCFRGGIGGWIKHWIMQILAG